MTDQKRILLVSRDTTILQTRKLVMSAYFEVRAAGRIPEARTFLSERAFDLIILCRTLNDDDCEAVIRAARERCAQIKILIPSTPGCSELTAAGHAYFAPEEGPIHLLKRSAEVLGCEFRKKPGAAQVILRKSGDCLGEDPTPRLVRSDQQTESSLLVPDR